MSKIGSSETLPKSIWGRAYVGGVSTSIIPARLSVDSNKIELQAFLGTYAFLRDRVVSIERASDSRITIHHVVCNYPRSISFIGKNVWHQIQVAGFVPKGLTDAMKPAPSPKSPFKAFVIVAIAITWNITPFIPYDSGARLLWVRISMAAYSVSGVSVLLSKTMQMIVLKPSARFREQKKAVIVSTLITILLLSWFVAGPSLCASSEIFCDPSSRLR